MIVAVLLTSLTGFIALALAMDKHCKHLLRRVLAPHWLTALRVAGWLLTLLSLMLCFSVWGWTVGLVAWTGWLMFAGILLVFYLPEWPWQPEPPKAPPRREKVVTAAAITDLPVKQSHWLRNGMTGMLLLVPIVLAVWTLVVSAGE
jgi:hypothetical protein